jgi:enoyl-[acyl-carrier-protein] reductase (NADH)
MGFLSGKRALIVGLATDRSIAWGIAQAMHAQGAELSFAHIERMTDRVVPLAKQLGSDITFVMDVASDEEIQFHGAGTRVAALHARTRRLDGILKLSGSHALHPRV